MLSEKHEQASILGERRAKYFWVTLIVSFFGIDLTIAAIAITMAAGDPSFRSIPGYGEQALAWDVRQSMKDTWESKGWKIDIRPASDSASAIEIQLADADNKPVVGCQGRLMIFHYTRVAIQTRATLQEVAPGHYRAQADVSKPGLWKLELVLTTPENEKCYFESSYEWNTELPKEAKARDRK